MYSPVHVNDQLDAVMSPVARPHDPTHPIYALSLFQTNKSRARCSPRSIPPSRATTADTTASATAVPIITITVTTITINQLRSQLHPRETGRCLAVQRLLSLHPDRECFPRLSRRRLAHRDQEVAPRGGWMIALLRRLVAMAGR